jgi:hypothetical protein
VLVIAYFQARQACTATVACLEKQNGTIGKRQGVFLRSMWSPLVDHHGFILLTAPVPLSGRTPRQSKPRTSSDGDMRRTMRRQRTQVALTWLTPLRDISTTQTTSATSDEIAWRVRTPRRTVTKCRRVSRRCAPHAAQTTAEKTPPQDKFPASGGCGDFDFGASSLESGIRSARHM